VYDLQVYVLKRPHVDEFLQKMGELFECVLFTASLGKVCMPDEASSYIGSFILETDLYHSHVFCNCFCPFVSIA